MDGSTIDYYNIKRENSYGVYMNILEVMEMLTPPLSDRTAKSLRDAIIFGTSDIHISEEDLRHVKKLFANDNKDFSESPRT